MALNFRHYIKKNEGTHVSAALVTEDNVADVRTLWKKPAAEVGDFFVRTGGDNHSKLMKPDHFAKYYRDPR